MGWHLQGVTIGYGGWESILRMEKQDQLRRVVAHM